MCEINNGFGHFSNLSEICQITNEILNLSVDRQLQEDVLSNEALKTSKKSIGISINRQLTEHNNSIETFRLAEKRRIIEHSQILEAFNLDQKLNKLENSLANQEICRLKQQIIQIIESLYEICLFFYDYHLIYVNVKGSNPYWSKVNLFGKTLSELLPKDINDKLLQTYRDDEVPLSPIYLESDTFQANKWFQFLLYPSKSGFIVCFNDITKMKLLEKESI